MACTSNAHGLQRNDDNGHSCIDITVVCTSNAYDSKRNRGNSPHSCIDITVVCTSNAYASKWITVIHTLIFQEVCASNAYGLQSNNDNSHS